MTSELHGGSASKPIRQTVLVADLKCYLCGAISGAIESEQPEGGSARLASRSGPRRNVRFRPVGADESVTLADWRNIHCARCGGPTYLDEPNIVVRRIEEYNWLDERPRRGRPPKRLVEERRRERELLEAQAAA
jgi:hypothetical protein